MLTLNFKLPNKSRFEKGIVTDFDCFSFTPIVLQVGGVSVGRIIFLSRCPVEICRQELQLCGDKTSWFLISKRAS